MPEKERKYLFLCDRKSCHKCIMSEDSNFKGGEWYKSVYTDIHGDWVLSLDVVVVT